MSRQFVSMVLSLWAVLLCISAMSLANQSDAGVATGVSAQPRRLNASELEPLPPPIRCRTCQRLVEFKYCESNKNGNQDRPVAMCKAKNTTTGVECNFYRFSGQRSPTLSPQPTFATLEDTTNPAVAPAVSGVCSTEGCGKKNIAKNCDKCKACCLGRGGCVKVKTHIVKGIQLAPQPKATPTASAPNAITPSTTNNGPRSNSAPAPVAQARHASHMLPSFTVQLEAQRALAEEKRKNDEERIQAEKRLQHTVVVYAWTANSTSAKSRIYQAGGNGPYFIVTKDVFSAVGLLEALEQGKVELFFEELAIWTHVGVDYSLSLKHKHHHIYFRHEDATLTTGLDDYMKAVRLSNGHIRHNLASERAYLRDAYKQQKPPTVLPQPRPVVPQAGPSKPQHVTTSSKRRHDSPSLSPDPFATNTAPLVSKDRSRPLAAPPPPHPKPAPKKVKLESQRPSTASTLPSHPVKVESRPQPRSLSPIDLTDDPKPRLFSPIDLTNNPKSPAASRYQPSPSPQAGPSTRFQGGASKADAIDIDSDTDVSSWPKDYQVYKIVALLRELRTAPRTSKSNGMPTHAQIFNKHFPDAVYVKSTVNDQKKRLKRAPEHLKKEAIDAGDGYLGKWSVFQQNVLLYEKEGTKDTPAAPGVGLGISMGAEFIDLTFD